MAMDFLQTAVLDLVANNPVLVNLHKSYMVKYGNNINLVSRLMWLHHIKDCPYYSEKYQTLVMEKYPKPLNLYSELDSAIIKLIREHGWTAVIKSITYIMKNRLNYCVWKSLPTKQIEKVYDKLKEVPTTLNGLKDENF